MQELDLQPSFEYLLPGDARRHAKLTWYWGAVIRACIQSEWPGSRMCPGS